MVQILDQDQDSPAHSQTDDSQHGPHQVLHVLVDHDAVDGLAVEVGDEDLACRWRRRGGRGVEAQRQREGGGHLM